ncbi:MAG: hypothetical protein H5T85_08085, partial [Actinobacteria bacterium]|nr:hypothetical protein [Actinomycetota bacterium]
MGVAKLQKLLVVTHKADEEEFLRRLKSISAVELNPYTQKLEPATSIQISSTLPSELAISNVKKALAVL